MGIMSAPLHNASNTFLGRQAQLEYLNEWYRPLNVLSAEEFDKAGPGAQRESEHAIMGVGIKSFDFGAVMLQEAVDNFMVYMAELLTMLFEYRPQTLRGAISKMALDASEVLEATNVRRIIIEKKIEQIDGKGIRGVLELLDRLGVNVGLTPEDKRGINLAIADRNILRHRRGVVDKEYLRITERTDLKIGDRIRVGQEQAAKHLALIGGVAGKISRAIGYKFGLDRRDGLPKGHPDRKDFERAVPEKP